jgi:hypothetical protein
MSRLNIGVGDAFPIEDAQASRDKRPYACGGGRRAHWAARYAAWEARRAARRARWLAWCAFWHGATPKAAAPNQDASYADGPASDDRDARS